MINYYDDYDIIIRITVLVFIMNECYCYYCYRALIKK